MSKSQIPPHLHAQLSRSGMCDSFMEGTAKLVDCLCRIRDGELTDGEKEQITKLVQEISATPPDTEYLFHIGSWAVDLYICKEHQS